MGEAAAISLYYKISADLLLIHDRKARQVAESMGVNCVGTLGILIAAKQSGKLLKLKPAFELFLNTGRFFSKNLLNEILADNDESNLP